MCQIVKNYSFLLTWHSKTELLLNLACRHRNRSNIFFLSAQDSTSLEEAYLFIANDLWSEILANRHPENDRYRIWYTLPRSERIDLFKRWLGAPENQNTFILVDDIDGLPHEDITEAIPARAKNIIITTRNPGLTASLGNARDLRFRQLAVTEMAMEDMAKFTTESLQTINNNGEEDIDFTDDPIQAISQAAVGHPLLAARAVSYILTDLMEQYDISATDKFIHDANTADLEERKALLWHKPPLQSSMMENFAVSRIRLSDPDGPTWGLMKLLAFTSLEDGKFHGFIFHPRPWVQELKNVLNFYDIWSAKHQLRAWMAELVQVSLAGRKSRREVLRFHPVIVQCVQIMVEPEERIQIMRDILILAYESARRLVSLAAESQDTLTQSFHAEALCCEKKRHVWHISQEELNLPAGVSKWLHSDGRIVTVQAPPPLPPSAGTSVSSTVHEISEIILQDSNIGDDLFALHKRCQGAKFEFEILHQKFSNQDANQQGKMLIFSLLKSLKDIDERVSKLSPQERREVYDHSSITRMDEVYGQLIDLARSPILHNHMLSEQLTRKREEAIGQLRALD